MVEGNGILNKFHDVYVMVFKKLYDDIGIVVNYWQYKINDLYFIHVIQTITYMS